MSVVLGLWVFALAITILLVWAAGCSFVESLKMIFGTMYFVTLIFISAALMAGGVK